MVIVIRELCGFKKNKVKVFEIVNIGDLRFDYFRESSSLFQRPKMKIYNEELFMHPCCSTTIFLNSFSKFLLSVFYFIMVYESTQNQKFNFYYEIAIPSHKYFNEKYEGYLSYFGNRERKWILIIENHLYLLKNCAWKIIHICML